LNPFLIHWYGSFLSNRQQLVRVSNTYSPLVTASWGLPQGCVSFPLLFTFYTNDCVSCVPNHHIRIYSYVVILCISRPPRCCSISLFV
ncbi:hypothetical protein LDENG_00129180, partial [Lucifuga dentata]